MITIDVRSRVPIYEQVKNQLLELILVGVLKPHDQVPSIRSLAQDLQLNVNTVKRAYQDLEAAGVIYTLSGRGSFVSEESLVNSQMKQRAMEEVKSAIRTGRVNGITREEMLSILDEIYV